MLQCVTVYTIHLLTVGITDGAVSVSFQLLYIVPSGYSELSMSAFSLHLTLVHVDCSAIQLTSATMLEKFSQANYECTVSLQ